MTNQTPDEFTPLPGSLLRKLVPELRACSPQTLCRWQRDGVKSKSGVRVKLASKRVGSRVMSSLLQVREFLAALNDNPLVSAAPIRTPAERQRESEEAAAKLDRKFRSRPE
jgi:hypothetical protein